MPTQMGHNPKVVFRNNSEKTITNITIVATMAHPHDASNFRGDRLGKYYVSNSRPQSIVIEPRATGKYIHFPASSLFVILARELRGSCIYAVTVVSSVEFADGTKLETDQDRRAEMWRKSAGGGSFCEDSDADREAVANVQGSNYLQDSYHPTFEVRQTLEYTCTIASGARHADCPM